MGPVGRVGHDGPGRRREHRLVEGDRDVRSERLLDGDRQLGRERVRGPVDMAAERDPVLVHDSQVAERHDLEAPGVGQDRPVPVHEPVEPTEPPDPLVPRPQVQVVGIRQDDRGPDGPDVLGRQRLDRRVRADRHELRGLHRAMGERQGPGARPGGAVGRRRGRDLVSRGGADEGLRHSASGVGSSGGGSSQSPTSIGSGRRGGGIS